MLSGVYQSVRSACRAMPWCLVPCLGDWFHALVPRLGAWCHALVVLVFMPQCLGEVAVVLRGLGPGLMGSIGKWNGPLTMPHGAVLRSGYVPRLHSLEHPSLFGWFYLWLLQAIYVFYAVGDLTLRDVCWSSEEVAVALRGLGLGPLGSTLLVEQASVHASWS